MLKSQKFNTRMLPKIASRSLSSKTHWPYHHLLNSRKTPLATGNPKPLTNDDLRGCQWKPQDVCFCKMLHTKVVGIAGFFGTSNQQFESSKITGNPPRKPLICVFPLRHMRFSKKRRQLDLSAGHGRFPRQPRPNGLKQIRCFKKT